jgi:alpha-amylase
MEVTEFNYARKLDPNFQDEGKLQYLNTFGQGWGLLPRDEAVVFIDNHDTQRGGASLTYKDGGMYNLINIFMLAHPYGYPKVMSSYYFNQHDQGPPGSPVHSRGSVSCGNGFPWVCEHRWTAIANMVNWRRSAGAALVSQFVAPGGNTVAFCRGGNACIALNRGGNDWSITVKWPLPPGKYCDVIQSDNTHTCATVTIQEDGSASLNVPALSAVALHVGKMQPRGGVLLV